MRTDKLIYGFTIPTLNPFGFPASYLCSVLKAQINRDRMGMRKKNHFTHALVW